MARNRNSFSSNTGFRDLLFNLVVGFVFLFVIAFILINPPVKKQEAPKKAEFLIVIEWQKESFDDVDLWVKDPNNFTVAFINKDAGFMNLEKDDLGKSNDCFINSMGEEKCVLINREVITIRGIQAGRFQVAAHIYNRPPTWNKTNGQMDYVEEPTRLTATLIKINPYKEVYAVERMYTTKGQTFTLFNFELDNEGKILLIDEYDNTHIITRNSSPVIPSGASRP